MNNPITIFRTEADAHAAMAAVKKTIKRAAMKHGVLYACVFTTVVCGDENMVCCRTEGRISHDAQVGDVMAGALQSLMATVKTAPETDHE